MDDLNSEPCVAINSYPRRVLVLAFTLSIGSLLITLYIDYLNEQAGDVLPRTEYVDDDPELGVVKWRVAMDPTTEQQKADIKLRSAVSTLGLVQYPLTLGVCLFSLGLLVKRVFYAVIPMLLIVYPVYRMFELSYFGSLGW